MADITQCPSCKRRLQLPDTHVGKPVQCPQCRNTFIAAETDSLPRSPSSLPTPKLDVEPPPPPPPPPLRAAPSSTGPERMTVPIDLPGKSIVATISHGIASRSRIAAGLS
ncbi:MAG: hypothetical protein U0744_12780 [Gemmataceae bacterium]